MTPRVLCIIGDLALGGGAEQLLAALVPLLRNLEFDVEIATLFKYSPSHVAALRAVGVVVHELDLPRGWNIVSQHRRLRALCRERKPDLVWGHLAFGNPHAVLLSRTFAAGPSIVTLHSESCNKRNPSKLWRDRLLCAIENWSLACSPCKVAVSQAVADNYATVFGWRGISVIYNGVNLVETPASSPDARLKLRASQGASGDYVLAVMPSRFVALKGHASLIEALALLKGDTGPGLRVLACSHATPLLGELQSLARQRGVADNIVFTGAMPHDQLFPLMQAADMAIMPSLSEAFSIAGLEALALGVPTILTRIDGFVELVGDSDGAILVPTNDPPALAAAIRRLRDDKTFGAAMAARGKARVEANFSMAACAQNWAGLFKSILAEQT